MSSMASFIDLKPNASFINNENEFSQTAETSITKTELNKEDQMEDGEISSTYDKNSDGSVGTSIPSPPYSIISAELEKEQNSYHLEHSSKFDYDQTELTIDRLKDRSKINLIESFKDCRISPELLKGIEAFIERPNETQRAILPDLLINRKQDIFVRVQPNSGKKTSYLIAAIERVNHSIKQTQVIIALPLQELVYYTFAYAQELAKYKGTTIREIVRYDELKSSINDQIIIGQTGYIFAYVLSRSINLSRVKCLIVDEVELNLSTNDYLQKMLDLVNNCRISQLQFYSNSFSHDDHYLNLIRKSITPDPLVFNFNNLSCLHDYLHFIVQYSNISDKIDKLITILKNVNLDKVLIYSSFSYSANYVHEYLKARGFNVIVLTNKSNAQQRLLAIHKFNSSKKIILISIYPLTQGIELLDLSIVINFDMKRGSRNRDFHYEYYNRISKCSRRTQASDVPYHNLVVNLVNKEIHDNMKCIQMLEQFYNIKMIEWKPTRD